MILMCNIKQLIYWLVAVCAVPARNDPAQVLLLLVRRAEVLPDVQLHQVQVHQQHQESDHQVHM